MNIRLDDTPSIPELVAELAEEEHRRSEELEVFLDKINTDMNIIIALMESKHG